ncbi:aminoglycoside phosphotransferase family protein [Aquihabitans daechungensis]|uniref:aminoglycoside phosphotransferase family protein n=1 Tax=Aquihabitans daechungensis TaxID=1052257 RepID=UPI003B9FFE1A
MLIPPGLDWMRGHADASRWLDGLPALVGDVAEAWGLTVGEPFAGSSVSWVAPARHDGDDVVLKVQWPHRECEHEAAALVAWAGDGAVALLAEAPDRHALLLERCAPGTRLADQPDVDAVAVMVDLLPRLWAPPTEPFGSLAEEAAGWQASLWADWTAAGEPCERRLVEAADEALRDLGPTQGEQVLLHQDLHGDNVLSAEREPWLAIDPKPLLGERELAVAPIVRDFQLGTGRAQVLGRLDRLTAELGLDRDRALGWTIGQTIAWAFSSGYADQHYETVRHLLDC